jgi:hypothetical protein
LLNRLIAKAAVGIFGAALILTGFTPAQKLIPQIDLVAPAQATCPVPYVFQDHFPGGPPQPILSGQINADFNAISNCVANLSTLQAIPTNTALRATPASAFPEVVRLGFYTEGDTPPLAYASSNSACSLNGGAGDNGAQVQSSDNKCWIAQFPAEGIDWRWYGGKPTGLPVDGATNVASLQAAFNYLNSLNAFSAGRVLVPAAANPFCLNANVSMGTLQGMYLVGASKLGASISACGIDTTLITMTGPRQHLTDLFLIGYGTNGTEFGATKPVLVLGDNCVECTVWDDLIVGGSNAIFVGPSTGDFVIGYTTAYGVYGNTIVELQGDGYLVRDKFDQPYPVVQPASGTQATPVNWVANTVYSSVGTIVSITQGGVPYWVQLFSAGTSGGSQPPLKAYNQNIPDGSAIWRFVGPAALNLVTIETTSTVMNILDTDFTGAALTGLSSGGASVQVLHSTFGGELNDGIVITAGSGFAISNSQLASGAGINSIGLQILGGGTFQGDLQFVNNLVWQWGAAGLDLQRGSEHLIESNQICGMSRTGGVAVHVPGGVSGFSIVGNQLGNCPAWGPNFNGVVVDAGGGDDFIIEGNRIRGVTNAAITNAASGVHVVIRNNTCSNNNTCYSYPNASLTSSAINPASTTSTSGVMMGLNQTLTPPINGVIDFTIQGIANNSVNNDGVQISARYGTGTAPVNGAAPTGTPCGAPQNVTSSSSAEGSAFSIRCSVNSALSLGTGYWIDVDVLALTGGTATIQGVSVSGTAQ